MTLGNLPHVCVEPEDMVVQEPGMCSVLVVVGTAVVAVVMKNDEVLTTAA